MQCIEMPFKDSCYVSMGILKDTLERFVYKEELYWSI